MDKDSIAQADPTQLKPSPIQRLERALRIALERAHGETDPANIQHAVFKIDALEDEEVGQKLPLRYQAWQDAKRLVNVLEAFEAAEGVEHVVVQQGTLLDRLYGLTDDELNAALQKALAEGDRHTANLARDILQVRETLASTF